MTLVTEESLKAYFMLAGIKILKYWRLPNGYWREASWSETNPCWLVKTRKGLVEIQTRKRVTEINWEETDIRLVVTEDDVSKEDTYVHAWTEAKFIEYLRILAKEINKV